MTTVRVSKKENPYVQVDKFCLSDDRISWKAKGLLVYLLSKPDGWKVRVGDLIKRSSDGRDSCYSGLKELERFGYLKRLPVRDEAGKILEWESVIYEFPLPAFPDMANPYEDKPYEEKPERINKRKILMNDSTKNHSLTNTFEIEPTADPVLPAIGGRRQQGADASGGFGVETPITTRQNCDAATPVGNASINKNGVPPQLEVDTSSYLANSLIRKTIALCKITNSNLASYQRKAIRAYPELAQHAVSDLEAHIREETTDNAAQCLGMLLGVYLGDHWKEFVKGGTRKKTRSSNNASQEPSPTPIPEQIVTEKPPKRKGMWIPEVGERVYYEEWGVFTVNCRYKKENRIFLTHLPVSTVRERIANEEYVPFAPLEECFEFSS